MSLLSWLIVGGLAGWIASMIMNKNAEMGLVKNIIVGIIGAYIGGGIVSLIGKSGVSGFNVWSVLVAVLGAVVLLWIVDKVTNKR